VKDIIIGVYQGLRERRPPLPQIMMYTFPLYEGVKQADLPSAMEVTSLGHGPP